MPDQRSASLQNYQRIVRILVNNATLTGTDSDKVFSNQGAAAGITITMPKAVPSRRYTFFIETAQTITLTPTSVDNFRGSAAGVNYVLAATLGNWVDVQCVEGDHKSAGIWEVLTPGGAGGGVTQIIAGSGISISPSGGTGAVTISAASPPAVAASFLATTLRGIIYGASGSWQVIGALPSGNITQPGAGTNSASGNAPGTSLLLSIQAMKFATPAGANDYEGIYWNNASTYGAFLNPTTATAGGFSFVAELGIVAINSDARLYVGMFSGTGPNLSSANPSTGFANLIGIGKDSGDTNISLLTTGNSAGNFSKTAFSPALVPATILGHLLQVTISAVAGSALITATVVDVDAGVTYTSSVTPTQTVAGTGPEQTTAMNGGYMAISTTTTTTACSFIGVKNAIITPY